MMTLAVIHPNGVIIYRKDINNELSVFVFEEGFNINIQLVKAAFILVR